MDSLYPQQCTLRTRALCLSFSRVCGWVVVVVVVVLAVVARETSHRLSGALVVCACAHACVA